jgi:hypothetical protein
VGHGCLVSDIPFPPSRASCTHTYTHHHRRRSTDPRRNISAQWSPRKPTCSVLLSQSIRVESSARHHRFTWRDLLLLLLLSQVVVSDSDLPPRLASHAGHATEAACDVVLGTLEMSSSGGGGYSGQSGGLRWTRDLHSRFVLAVSALGGADSEFSSCTILLRLCSALVLTTIAAFPWHYCRGDAQVRAEGNGRAGAHAAPHQELSPGLISDHVCRRFVLGVALPDRRFLTAS